ncbi:MAG: DUF47 family protein [Methanomicrobiaceae archaeon]|nr:DUF47 family protein [Methanomicrobiaceae archaeon]
MDRDTGHQDTRRRGVFDVIFPREYDFEQMLETQAGGTLEGVETFVRWLHSTPLEEPSALEHIEEEVDAMRHDMEDKLISSFSTPFDRQDIYSLSRQMDYILNFSEETAREMYAFGVSPDLPILDMAGALLRGTRCMARGVAIMHTDRKKMERTIREARRAMREIEEIYITSMAELLHTDDAMNALRKREVYHHLRDAGRALRNSVDILHTAVVGRM